MRHAPVAAQLAAYEGRLVSWSKHTNKLLVVSIVWFHVCSHFTPMWGPNIDPHTLTMWEPACLMGPKHATETCG